jgi:hypothetical protein
MTASQWGETPPEGNHGSGLPYLADTGCTLAPHLRPACTGYLCPEALSAAPVEVQQEYHDIRGFIARLEQPG